MLAPLPGSSPPRRRLEPATFPGSHARSPSLSFASSLPAPVWPSAPVLFATHVLPTLFQPSARHQCAAAWAAAFSTKCNGVRPLAFCRLLSAPSSTSARTAGTFPQKAAQCNGVSPFASFTLMSAPSSTSARTAPSCPSAAA
eukprot:431778-Prorocentrum_minimum.AAC.1